MTQSELDNAAAARQPFPSFSSDGLPLTPLPRDFYTSQDWFETDVERVYRRRWLYVCHVSEIAKTGDYVTFELGADSIVVARDSDRNINAFHNVCRHRGARLCNVGNGHSKLFICPYHAWSYNLDGSLRAAPEMPDLDKMQYGAIKVRSEIWNGFVFINLSSDEGGTVAEGLAATDFSGHQMERAKIIKTDVHLVDVNWKMMGENNQECYHCGGVHRNSLAKVIKGTENHLAYANQEEPDSGFEYMLYSPDLRNGSLIAGAQTQTQDGQVVCKKLFGSEPQPPKLVVWFPNFTLAAFPDFAFIYDWLPVSATQTLFRSTWFVHEDAVEGEDYTVAQVVDMHTRVNEEDIAILERQQAGINSSAYVPGPFHIPLENDTRRYVNHYLRMIQND
jgi:phenylpropionate dioxygenase-like ring-hydroxylating dioxygenase large terminal subunit